MFTIGTDTEFFLEEEGNLISAIDLIKAGKHNPIPLRSGGGLTHDNVAMEWATPVAADEESFVDAIRTTLVESLEVLPKGVKINLRASANFPKKELDSEEAKLFGCDPDYDAWLLQVNEPPRDAAIKPFRTVGGHLHVGYVEGSGNDFLKEPLGKVALVKVFDLIIGIPMTIMDHGEDAVNRRKLYGKAGCHRPTSYGVEYRSLSNFWTFSPKLVRLVYSLASESIRLFKEGSVFAVLDTIDPEEIQRVINEGDSKAAIAMWKKIVAPLLNTDVVEKFNQTRRTRKYNIYEEWGI